ncbi:hypothetical protein TIFTF001_021363 [Ficus carica]|uniref:3'-5' exonuclease domain-containing protein n=1 Tax=Ficus carica TaxID=3494 RepID=A0AA88DEH9_FICCA|nr:hypothetical protein TIFTF001_021363 [Ficus carica]
MVMEITVTSAMEPDDRKNGYDAYSVHISDHRILTIVTASDNNLSKWLKNVLKSSPNTKSGDTILVGISAYRQTGGDFSPFNLLSLCVGSHCLFYRFPNLCYDDKFNPKSLNAFFQNPRVVAVGFDAVSLAKKLEKLHGITIKNAVDVRDVPNRGLPNLNVDFRRRNLDEIARAVIGRHMEVIRPEKKTVPWFTHHYTYYYYNPLVPKTLTDDQIKFSTLDPYLSFLIAFELIEAVNDASSPAAKDASSPAVKSDGDSRRPMTPSQADGSSTTAAKKEKNKNPDIMEQQKELKRTMTKNMRRRARRRARDLRDRTVFVGIFP